MNVSSNDLDLALHTSRTTAPSNVYEAGNLEGKLDGLNCLDHRSPSRSAGQIVSSHAPMVFRDD